MGVALTENELDSFYRPQIPEWILPLYLVVGLTSIIATILTN